MRNFLTRKALPALVRHLASVLRAVGSLKAGKAARLQRVRLAKGRHIGAQIIEPHGLGAVLIRFFARKEKYVGLDTLRVKNACRQAQNSVQIALIHQVDTNLFAVTVGKQHIVRQHYGSARLAVSLQAAVDMLQEVQLLVARGIGEVVTRCALTAFFRAEGRIGQHNVIALHFLAHVGKRITQNNFALDIMQHSIHQRQAVRIMHQLTAGEGLRIFKLGRFLIQIKEIVRLLTHKIAGSNHKTEGTAGRIIAALAGLGCHQARHYVNQHTRRKVLPGTALLFVSVFLQQSFVKITQSLLLRAEPVQLVNRPDNLFQVLRLINVRRRALVNLLNASRALLAQVIQQILVKALQLQSLARQQIIPAIALRDIFLAAGFLSHLQKQNICQLRNVLMIGNAVITQHITQIPELCYNLLCIHAVLPPSSYK